MCSRVGHSLHPLNGTPGSASVWAYFVMGFGRRCRERLGVAIMFLALPPFCPGGRPLEAEIVLALNPA